MITKILNLDPSKRPTLDELLEHSFLNFGKNIPKLLPLSTLACPLSEEFKKFLSFFFFLHLNKKKKNFFLKIDNMLRAKELKWQLVFFFFLNTYQKTSNFQLKIISQQILKIMQVQT